MCYFYIENLGRRLTLSISAIGDMENRRDIATFSSAANLAAYLPQIASPNDIIRGLGGLADLQEIEAHCVLLPTSIVELDRLLSLYHDYTVEGTDGKITLYCVDDDTSQLVAEFENPGHFMGYVESRLSWNDSVSWNFHRRSVLELLASLVTPTH